jgi:hypothetical protein
MGPVVATACVAWKGIGFYVMAEAQEHWMDLKVYEFSICRSPGDPEWDGQSPVIPGKPPLGFVFPRKGAISGTDSVETTEEAQVYLSGSIKWDGCSNLYFDEQDSIEGTKCSLHFCGKQEAMNVGVLMGRLYDLAAKIIPAWSGD